MKKDRRHIRHMRHARVDGQAVLGFFKRFGFVLFIAIIFLMLTFAVAFSQKPRNQIDKTKDAQARISLGDTYMQQGNGGMAVSNYEEAALLSPQDPLPHFKIGTIYLRSKNSEAAMEEFQKSISIDPDYAPAYKELAELYYISKNGAEAVKAQQKYMELSGSPDDGLVRLGYYLFMTKDFAKTNDAFGKAYQKGLLKDTGLRYYALSLVESGDYAEGQKMFEEYLSKARPEQIEASDYASYGKLLLKLGQDSLATIAFGKSLSIDSKQTAIQQLQAETLFKEKHFGEAVGAYKTLIGLRSKATSQDVYSLGRSYYYNQQFAEADTTFNKLIGMQPTMTVGYLWTGRAKAQLDPETTEGLAKISYEKLIEIGQATPDKSKADLKEAYSYLGYYYYLKKNAALSRANWEKVLALDPQDERAREALKAIK